MMDGLRIRRDSWYVRWAYLGSDWAPPHEESLCVLFWRGFLVTPLKVVVIGGVALLLGRLLWVDAEARWMLGTIVAVVSIPPTAVLLKRHLLGEPSESVVFQVASHRMAAWKARVCPTVQIVSREEPER